MKRPRPSSRAPVGPEAGLKTLLELYADASLGFKLFVAHRWWHARMPAVEAFVVREGTVLDLGCGHGIFANLMGLRGPQRRILALEKNSAKAAFAHGRVSNVTVENRDIRDEQFPTVDAVTLIDVLHHLSSFEEQVVILDAVHRILPVGGQLVLKEVSRSRKVRYRLTCVLDRLAYPGDVFYFRRHEEFLKILAERGFSTEFHPLWSHVPYAHYVVAATKRR